MAFVGTRPGNAPLLYGNCSSRQNGIIAGRSNGRSLRDTATELTSVKELKKIQVNNLAALSTFKPQTRSPTPRLPIPLRNRPPDNHLPQTPMDLLRHVIHLPTPRSRTVVTPGLRQ